MEEIKIGNRYIGENHPVFVVAEIGQNHNGSMEIAKQLINQAAHDKVDAVKFCKRHIPLELTKERYNQPYLSVHSFGETYGKHREFLELSKEQYAELKKYAESKGLIFFASVCDIQSADDLDDLGVEMFKVASRDLTNKPLIEHLAKKGKPIFLSTGMSNIGDIENAVNLIKQYHDKILIFHCTSEYPCPYEHLNLTALISLRDKFNLNVGLSDHSVGIMAPCAAAVMGAVAVEKHITLDKHMKGTDHAGALDPPGMERLVVWIRNFEKAKGYGVKSMINEEFITKIKLARSIVAKRKINMGEILTKDMITAKSHTSLGLNPFDDHLIIGKKLKQDINEDELILVEHVE
jgi:sialic acid synthase SpsE